MSMFSDRIQELISNSGHTVYEISKKSGLGRTSIQKMMTGTLIPGRVFMNDFYHYMRVSISERRELEQLYSLEKDGREHCENRIFIKKMLEGIEECYEEKGLEKDFFSDKVWYAEKEYGHNRFDTLGLIYEVLKMELDQYEIPCIEMNIPFGNRGISALLFHLCRENPKLKVRQLVVMNSNPMKLQDANYNLKILHQILPLALAFPSQYQVHQCYSKSEENDYDAFFWPYYMITHQHVIMISPDGTSAYIQKEEQIVRMFQEKFEELYKKSDLLLEQYQDPFVAFQNYVQNYYEYGIPDYTLENNPCLAHLMEKDTLHDLLGEKMEEFPEFANGLAEFYQKIYSYGKFPVGFFSRGGLEHFYQTGKIFDQSGFFVHGIKKEKRTQMLQNFVTRNREYGIESHLVMENELKIPSNLMIELFGTKKLLLFHSKEPGKLNFIQIHESSICEAFQDFMNYMTKSHIALTTEETLEYIEKFC